MTLLSLTALGTVNAQALNTNRSNVVINLQNSSLELTNQINKALAASANMSVAAYNEYIVDPNAYQSSVITYQQQQAYNDALSQFQGTEFYTAKDLLQDSGAGAIYQMQIAINNLATAAVQLQTVAIVNDIVNGVNDVPTANSAQKVLESAGLDTQVTTEQVDNFNSSLQMVNAYASQAGAFFSASKNESITSSVDLTALNYNKSIYTASTSYTYGTDSLSITFADSYSMSFDGLLTSSRIDADTFYNNPSFYGGQ